MTIWYEDPTRKQVHRDLVVDGMERARQQGKRIGRPRVSERPEFEQRFTKVVERIGPGGLSRRQAARELGIGYATLKRLLDGCGQTKALLNGVDGLNPTVTGAGGGAGSSPATHPEDLGA